MDDPSNVGTWDTIALFLVPLYLWQSSQEGHSGCFMRLFDMFQHLPVSPRQGFSSCIGFPALHEHNLGWTPSSSYNMNSNITALHSAECAVNLNCHICSPVSLLYCHGARTEILPLRGGGKCCRKKTRNTSLFQNLDSSYFEMQC